MLSTKPPFPLGNGSSKLGLGVLITADQIEFVNLIVDHVTAHGFMLPARLYESPFTDVSPTGPDGVFADGRVDALIGVLHEVQDRALA